MLEYFDIFGKLRGRELTDHFPLETLEGGVLLGLLCLVWSSLLLAAIEPWQCV
jgi:hypothetical protein